METDCEVNVEVAACPDASVEIEAQIRQATDEWISFVNQDCDALKLYEFEQSLWLRVAMLFRLYVALFLAVRRQRLDLSEYTGDDWRVKEEFAPRTIKTTCGPVCYGRAYLTRRNGGGWFPLDAMLGITPDGFSLRVVDMVTRLATRLSYSATRGVVKAILGWAPSTEATELV